MNWRMLKHQVIVPDWWDVFLFGEPATITCPDCEHESPELEDIWTAVTWVGEHLESCAGQPT
jgi:hypothetical protein